MQFTKQTVISTHVTWLYVQSAAYQDKLKVIIFRNSYTPAGLKLNKQSKSFARKGSFVELGWIIKVHNENQKRPNYQDQLGF